MRHCELVQKIDWTLLLEEILFKIQEANEFQGKCLLGDLLINSGTSNFKVIKKVKRDDSGGYRCTASNLQGTKGSHVVTVDVHCKLISQTFS